MSALFIIIFTLVTLIFLILAGVHLGVSLMLTSVIGIFLATGNINTAINILGAASFSAIREYIFGVIPLFVLMGLLANMSGASKELYDASNEALKKIKGGVGIATIIANAIFAAITGVSIASAAVFTKIAVPQMNRLGYDKKLSVGTVAGSSILGMLIPPSILMIVYGTLAEQSVGHLFIAGIIPGLIMTLAFILAIRLYILIKPESINIGAKDVLENTSTRESIKIILRPWAIAFLICLTLGGIWLGFFTPTEAGGIGSFGALLLVIIKKKFSLKGLWKVLLTTGVTTGSILFLLISAQMYSRTLAISGAINFIEDFVISLNMPNMMIIFIFMGILIALGCILDSTSILLLTMPVMCPIVRSFGMNLVWFGIVAIVAIETGLLTPPFGLSVYTVKSSLDGVEGAEDMTIEDIFKGSFPFLISMFFRPPDSGVVPFINAGFIIKIILRVMIQILLGYGCNKSSINRSNL